MVETWNVNTHIYIVSENIAFSTKALLILLRSTFFGAKFSIFFGKNTTFAQSYGVRAVLQIF